MAVISVDLAYRKYSDIGLVVLRLTGETIDIEPLRLTHLGGDPSSQALAKIICELAEQCQSSIVFLDGPQGWKDPANGLEHCRLCERQLATPGKTGLPGNTKPQNYLSYISFSIDVFDSLANRGWGRLSNTESPLSSGPIAIESFPTSAWRSIGLTPLPGKKKTANHTIIEKQRELEKAFPIIVKSGGLSHDELQAVVAGLAGIEIERKNQSGYEVVGAPPFKLAGSWREGFIVNPKRYVSG